QASWSLRQTALRKAVKKVIRFPKAFISLSVLLDTLEYFATSEMGFRLNYKNEIRQPLPTYGYDTFDDLHLFKRSLTPALQFPSSSTFVLASFLPLSDAENAELALDIEFENEWETTSDWNEDDVEVIAEERELCYPHLRRKGPVNDEENKEQEMDIDL
ncbi:hypothetical protein K503DRAFT_788054, partial [Rhizopogon vinicolor AM-OR11-026]